MANTLKFDIEKLTAMKNKLDEIAAELDSKKNSIVASMDKLKTEWNTPAGKKFLKDVDTDWTEEVDKYVQVVNALSSIMNCAISAYEQVEIEATKLQFYHET